MKRLRRVALPMHITMAGLLMAVSTTATALPAPPAPPAATAPLAVQNSTAPAAATALPAPDTPAALETPSALPVDPAVALSTEETAVAATGTAVAPIAPVQADSDGTSRSGRTVYEKFRTGLTAGHCDSSNNARWRNHFSSAPERLAATNSQVMPVFAHVVEALREARLPSEYALIPFVESEYRPQARSKAGPAGLWQFIASTARSLKLTVGKGIDARMSPIESTRAAVQYLATLHKRFGGNWRLAVMAYNAGENRVHGELRRSGRSVQDAGPQHLAGLPSHTRSYVEKLHALSCMMHRAGDREEWIRSLDRPVRAIGSTAAVGQKG